MPGKLWQSFENVLVLCTVKPPGPYVFKNTSFWFSSIDRYNEWTKLVGWKFEHIPFPLQGRAKQIETAKELKKRGVTGILYDPVKAVEASLQIDDFIRTQEEQLSGDTQDKRN